jgi:hypothetical protein
MDTEESIMDTIKQVSEKTAVICELQSMIVEGQTICKEIVEDEKLERAARVKITQGKRKERFNLFCEYLGACCGGDTLYFESFHVKDLERILEEVEKQSGYCFVGNSMTGWEAIDIKQKLVQGSLFECKRSQVAI